MILGIFMSVLCMVTGAMSESLEVRIFYAILFVVFALTSIISYENLLDRVRKLEKQVGEQNDK